MDSREEWPEEAEGLWLVRAFLTLPPEKRGLVLRCVEELSREQERRGEGAEAPSTSEPCPTSNSIAGAD